MYIATRSPAGGQWMVANGPAISRSTYSVLFGLIGTTYGAGDGSTTFNLPNFAGKMPLGTNGSHPMAQTGGAETVTLSWGQMPVHDHVAYGDGSTAGYAGGIAAVGSYFSSNPPSHPGYLNRTTSAAGSGQAHENMPPFLVVNFIIKVL